MSYVESGVQLFARVSPRACLEGMHPILFGENHPKPNEAIDILGAPEADKTSLALDILIRCILPGNLNPEWKGRSAVLILTDFQINIHNIAHVMNFHLKKVLNSSVDIKAVIEESLDRLTLFNCYDQSQFEITVCTLEKIIQEDENIALVLVENITSQYWPARFASDDKLSLYSHALTNYEYLLEKVKNLNVVLVSIRIKGIQTNDKPLHNSITFRIEVENLCDNNFLATVRNVETAIEIEIPFNIKETINFN